ncbi:hypothetical protein J437_LFUL004306 [Ladona fulva]|uniref:Protein-tyrosine sulfotransferase n=1 Tax=Ladona fulva TaxID=123851 RepID=A0A8K0JX77_LADFU|nr:hypothetical protein J437_LFUL004306 [Ladona fulva]
MVMMIEILIHSSSDLHRIQGSSFLLNAMKKVIIEAIALCVNGLFHLKHSAYVKIARINYSTPHLAYFEKLLNFIFQVLDSAIAAFCLEVIARHGEPAPRLCNKDPLTLKSAVYLSELFPAAKFILMVRDGRATVHSIISRKDLKNNLRFRHTTSMIIHLGLRYVTITGFDLTSYRQCLAKWNAAVSAMHSQCLEVGPKRCLVVHYEQLVLHPRSSMANILQFLDVPWNETVLHHEKLINKPGGVSLSKVERSSDQVIRPVNLDALAKWVGHIPEDVVKDMPHLAPMLSVLGYDPHANPPAYGAPDPIVADNTRRMRRDEGLWRGKAQDILGHVNGTMNEKVSLQNENGDNVGEAPLPKD